MSYNLVLNSSNAINSNTFKYNFINGSLDIPEGSTIAISQITIPYSWFNVSSIIGNNTFSYFIPNSSNTQIEYKIIIPNGFYQVSDLNIYLQSQLKINGHYWYSTQGINSGNITFLGSITGTTLTITPGQLIQVSIGYVIQYIPNSGTTYTTSIITAILSASTFTVSTPSTTTSVTMIIQTNNEIIPTIIYPLSFSTYSPLYCNQIISLTIPTNINIYNIFGAYYVYANGLNGQSSWAGGYPTIGNQCAYITFNTTSATTTTIGNLLGFTSSSIYNTIYPSNISSLSVLSQTINGNSLSSFPPFSPLGSSVNGVIVRCNLVENNITIPSDVMDNFPITSQFGSNINYLPISNNAMKLIKGRHSNLIITFNDQNFNPLLMNDSNVLISIMIYYPKKN